MKQSGVYIIRSKLTGRCLYVGESHTGRLRGTMLRHFQKWTGERAGPTFDRNACTVRIIVTAPEAAIAKQNETIRRLRPYHNTEGKPAPKNLAQVIEDIVPF